MQTYSHSRPVGGSSWRRALLASAIAGSLAARSQAALVVEVFALPGTGYTVGSGGKTVSVTGTAPVSINMELRGSITGGASAANSVISQTWGSLVTTGAGPGGYLTGGAIGALTLNPNYTGTSFQTGTSKTIALTGSAFTDDGVTDRGALGTSFGAAGSGSTLTRTVVGATVTGDYINLVGPTTSANPLVNGNNIQLATFALSASSFSGVSGATTTVDWLYRSGTGNHSWVVDGAGASTLGTRTFGVDGVAGILGGAPVSIVSAGGGGGGDPSIAASGGPLTFNLLKGASTAGVTQSITLTNSSSTAATGSTATVSGVNATKFSASNPGAVGASGGTAASTVGLTAGATSTSGTFTASVDFASTPGSVPAINSVGVTLNVGNATTGPSNAFGTALTAVVGATGTYAPLSASTSTVGTGTTVSMVAGTNATGGSETVSMAFRTPTTSETNTATLPYLLSDVVQLTGMSSSPLVTSGASTKTDAFALQMSYTPPGSLAPNLAASYIGVYWLNGASQWVQSRFGNFLGGDANGDSVLDGALAIGGYQGTYAQFATQYSVTDANLSNFLGSYGVDTVGGTAWTVLNHNSSFAVAIPEPTTLVFGGLAMLGFAAHGLRKRRTLKA